MKTMWKKEGLSWLLLIIAFGAGSYFYGKFPARVASHWNIYGQVDGYSSKEFGAWGIPVILAMMYGMFLALPKLDPEKERYSQFQGTYLIIREAILAVLLLSYLVTGWYNLGYPIEVGKVIPITIGIMFMVMGNYMGKLKRNWFVGVKTPWTLSSENVWNKTHRVSGFIFMMFGFGMLVTPLVSPSLAMLILITGVAGVTAGMFGYSWWLARQEKQKRNL